MEKTISLTKALKDHMFAGSADKPATKAIDMLAEMKSLTPQDKQDLADAYNNAEPRIFAEDVALAVA